jgi:hypothetical protein
MDYFPISVALDSSTASVTAFAAFIFALFLALFLKKLVHMLLQGFNVSVVVWTVYFARLTDVMGGVRAIIVVLDVSMGFAGLLVHSLKVSMDLFMMRLHLPFLAIF